MAKKELTPEEIYEQISSLTFEEWVEIFDKLRDKIKDEAIRRKNQGSAAEQVLKTIENGK